MFFFNYMFFSYAISYYFVKIFFLSHELLGQTHSEGSLPLFLSPLSLETGSHTYRLVSPPPRRPFAAVIPFHDHSQTLSPPLDSVFRVFRVIYV